MPLSQAGRHAPDQQRRRRRRDAHGIHWQELTDPNDRHKAEPPNGAGKRPPANPPQPTRNIQIWLAAINTNQIGYSSDAIA